LADAPTLDRSFFGLPLKSAGWRMADLVAPEFIPVVWFGYQHLQSAVGTGDILNADLSVKSIHEK